MLRASTSAQHSERSPIKQPWSLLSEDSSMMRTDTPLAWSFEISLSSFCTRDAGPLDDDLPPARATATGPGARAPRALLKTVSTGAARQRR